MDSRDSGVEFDDNGVCNYCKIYEERHQITRKLGSIDEFVRGVKHRGKRKKYDCIIGVSGGVDSSWVIAKAVELGFKPLAVHMDNGWNSELAQNNIYNLVNGLGVDLYTYVIDWEEYRGMMQAFFDSDVVDIELLYDNAMRAVNYRMARKYHLKDILSGSNTATEGFPFPTGWSWYKKDKRNIKSIVKKFSSTKIRTFPLYGTLDSFVDGRIRGIQWHPFLDYIDYDKSSALNVLGQKYQYKKYPYKHYESIFTRFYQGYILPHKFGIDKRKSHLGALVMQGSMSREAALEDLEKIPYPSADELESDKQYFLKKMGWSEAQLVSYLKRPPVDHAVYGTERFFIQNIRKKLHWKSK